MLNVEVLGWQRVSSMVEVETNANPWWLELEWIRVYVITDAKTARNRANKSRLVAPL